MLTSQNLNKLQKIKSKNFIFDLDINSDTSLENSDDINLKPDHTELIPGNIYNFYRINKIDDIYVFSAKFINSYVNNDNIIIRLTNVQDKTNIGMNDILSIPYSWIIKVEEY